MRQPEVPREAWPVGQVLFIESNRATNRRARRTLESRGHLCRSATTIRSARRALLDENADVLVLPADQLEPDGTDLIRDCAILPTPTMVLVTCDETTAHLGPPALRHGASDVFIKGGESDVRLTNQIEALLGGEVEATGGRGPHAAGLHTIFQAQLEATSDAMLITDFDGRALHCNKRFLALWNADISEIEQKDAASVLARRFETARSLNGGSVRPALLLRNATSVVADQRVLLDGRETIAWSSRPVRVNGSVVGRSYAFRDLTIQAAAEDQVQFHGNILKHVPVAVVATSLDGVIVYWNEFASRLHGWSAHDAVGELFCEALFPSDQTDKSERALTEARAQGRWTGETLLTRVDGSTFPALLTLTSLPGSESRAPLILGVIMDLTGQRALEAKLLQSQKMEAVGTLAGGLAHDFNNLLTGVLGSASLARELPDLRSDVVELMEMIERAALRGRDLCGQLLSFSRAERPAVNPVRTIDVISEVVKIVERTFPKEVRVSVETGEAVPPLMADRSRINQALMNLLVNARDAMPDGGPLVVRASLSVGVPSDALHMQVEDGQQYVRLEVQDVGHGMERDVLERMFEPFFTTKGSGKGTGLGLAMVFSIAKSHGGAVRVWTEVNAGTTVALFIPAAAAAALAATPSPGEQEVDPTSSLEQFAGSETVLVVDDEAIVRSVATRILRQFGYRTREAASGPEALKIVEEQGDALAAILLDIVMPEMEGPEVYRRLVERGVTTPVLMCSGFSVAGIVEGLKDQGVAGFVEKPYRLDELLPKLRETINARAPASVSRP